MRWLPDVRPVFLNDVEIPPELRIVVLAPHPDDFDAIAVTMRRFHENGNLIELAVVTSGASGVEDGFEGALTADTKAALREQEQRASCAAFGLADDRIRFLRLREDAGGHPVDSALNHNLVGLYLDLMRPDLVFLPHGNDDNPGHQRVYVFYQKHSRGSALRSVAFLNRDPKTISMREDAYTTFPADAAAWKAGLLRVHRSQHQRNLNMRGYGFDDRILELNRQTAAALGCEDAYAECFEVEIPQ